MKRKLSTRPISSPGRIEKFPPPLMRFLRTNAGSRSRGSRSRASPIFIKQRTKGSAAVLAADTKEPSSPKVTCMGQVRVRRSNQDPTKPGRPTRWRCWWIPRILFCQSSKCEARVRFSFFRVSKCCAPGLPKWGSSFRFGSKGGSVLCGFGGRSKDFRDRTEDARDRTEDAVEEDEDYGVIEGKGNCLGSLPCSPPNNALILTRCRSAPHTSSSHACRFWGSPFDPEKTEHRRSTEKTEQRLSTEKTEHRRSTEKTEQRLSTEKTEHRRSTEKTEHRRSVEKIEPANRRLEEDGGEQEETESSDVYPPDREPDNDCKVTNSEGTCGSIGDEDHAAAKSENNEHTQVRDRDTDAEVVQPLMLTRCKSEPARTREKMLDLEVVMGGGDSGGRRRWESSILVLHVHCD